MRIPFHSAWELKTLFGTLGLDMRVVQITAGELSGLFELGGHATSPVLSIRTNQGLLFEGSRHPRWTPIALENSSALELHRVRGEAISHHCVHGFNRRLTDSFFQISPGAHLSTALLNSQRLLALMELMGDEQLFDAIETINSVAVRPLLFKQMQDLLRIDTTTEPELHQELLQAAVVECLRPG
ncbi:MAG: AraC family transcriptional regulator, partial [Synechococcus sp.]